MNKVIVLKGCPASGKSTFAQQLCGQGWKRINNDDLRKLIDFSVWSPDNEAVIKTATELLLTEFVKSGFNVVIDNVHAGKQHFDKYYRILERLNISCQLEELPFYVDLETAIARDAERTGTARVGKEVVTKWWKKLGGESFRTYVPRKVEFKRVEPVIQNTTLPPCYIFDLDNTLADNSWRSPYDATRCEEDPVNKDVMAVLMALWADQNNIVFVSGRSDEYYTPTLNWLKKHFHDRPELLMRKKEDKRADFLVKKDIFMNDILPFYNTLGVFDDRTQVVNGCWRALGLRCYQVCEGDF